MRTRLHLTPGDHGRTLTWEEFASADAQRGYRYELIEGKVYVTSFPSLSHQCFRDWLYHRLDAYADERPDILARVMPSPVVFIPTPIATTFSRTDIACYAEFANRFSRDADWRDYSPILVVEVLSKDDPKKDLIRNRGLYLQTPSIQEYWILDPGEGVADLKLIVYRRRGSRWGRRRVVSLGGNYSTPLLPGFSLVLDATVGDDSIGCKGTTMTEQQWLKEQDPKPMLEFIRRRANERNLRLFACGCCRGVWGLLSEDCRELVEMIEKSVDLPACDERIRTARIVLRKKILENDAFGPGSRFNTRSSHPARACLGAADDNAFQGAKSASLNASRRERPHPRGGANAFTDLHALKNQSEILRDIVGNPWYVGTIDPSWLAANDQAVRQVARSIYNGSVFDDLPVLADALEEAGCSDATLLDHLRGSGPHYRGCWAVDLVLDSARDNSLPNVDHSN